MMMVIAITEKGEKKMPRYIDADILPKLFDEEYKKTRKLIEDGETHLDNLAEGFSEAARVVTFVALTTADVQEVRHGEWQTIRETTDSKTTECTACMKSFFFMRKGQLNIDLMPYCPHCGAKMKGGDG